MYTLSKYCNSGVTTVCCGQSSNFSGCFKKRYSFSVLRFTFAGLRLLTLLLLYKMPNFESLKEALPYHKFLKIHTETNTDLLSFCEFCSETFKCQKSNHVEDHINGNKHTENSESKKPRQQQLVTKSSGHAESSFNYEFVETWIGAGLPISALKNKKLTDFLEQNFKMVLPSYTTRAQNYAEDVHSKTIEFFSLKSWNSARVSLFQIERCG